MLSLKPLLHILLQIGLISTSLASGLEKSECELPLLSEEQGIIQLTQELDALKAERRRTPDQSEVVQIQKKEKIPNLKPSQVVQFRTNKLSLLIRNKERKIRELQASIYVRDHLSEVTKVDQEKLKPIVHSLMVSNAKELPSTVVIASLFKFSELNSIITHAINTIANANRDQLWAQFESAKFEERLDSVMPYATVEQKNEIETKTKEQKELLETDAAFSLWATRAFPSPSRFDTKERSFKALRDALDNKDIEYCCNTTCSGCLYNYPLRVLQKNSAK